MIFAEVIGEPVAQSKSPVIHKYWLDRLGIGGDYVRTRVSPEELAGFLDRRRTDADWRGCNVTIPHKQAIMPLLDRLDPGAGAIGAVNCVVPEDGALLGYNTDIDGIAAALDSTEVRGRKAALIGAGGAARAVVAYLASRGVGRIALLVRNPARAKPLRALAPGVRMDIFNFGRADEAFGGAATIINASPLGMAGTEPVPRSMLEAVRSHAAGATVFDLVTTPAGTEFLSCGANGGGQPVDGLTMLVSQAARAFELFFGAPAPPPDETLRDLLATVRPNSA
jgi:shikimate dehydrogenase